jgi:hypothetical protein
VPVCEIFFMPETGCYGYRYRFQGRKPHITLDTCWTLEAALNSCDPHREHVWREAPDADEDRILISDSYQAGSVLDILSS